jgi:hypothetical protein
MLHPHPARAGISGWHVAGVLGLILLATAVLPPVAASRLNQSRIEQAEADTRRIAAYLQHAAQPRTAGIGGDVVCGTGRLPKPGTQSEWLRSPETRADIFGADRPRDPWGRCYLANIGGLRTRSPVLVLSAGPNGLIDTVLGAPSPQGDDVGMRVW